MKRHWAQRFFDLAHVVAGWSKDPERKVGAVLVSPDRRQVSWGFNGFPAGVEDTELRLRGDMKNDFMVHAEINAILNARQDLDGWWLFVTRHPCQQCANAIIQAGIEVVVCPEPAAPPSKWRLPHQLAEQVMKEAGVHIQHMTPPSSSPVI